MTPFSHDVQLVSLGMLILLLLYTLLLSRYRGLDAHVTVRWVLVQGAAILTVLLWRWLPLFQFTSGLQDRQLLLLMTVVFFAFTAFFMLDTLVRLSRHTDQIKRLTQELAIQASRLDAFARANDRNERYSERVAESGPDSTSRSLSEEADRAETFGTPRPE
jgi:hypothetical protein